MKPPAMVIGIDASGWSNRRGFGRFTRSLVRALVDIDRSNEYVLFFDGTPDPQDAVPEEARCVLAATSEPQGDAILPGRRRRAADLWRMSAAVHRTPPDLFYFPSIDGYFLLTRDLPTVVTIHDLIPEREPHLTVLSRRERLLRRCKVWLALRQADRIVTGSERLRADICAHFSLPPDRVATVPYGADPVFCPPRSITAVRAWAAERFGLRGRYLLCVAAAGPHKNLASLHSAFGRVARQPRFDDVALVVAGQGHSTPPQQAQVRFAGHVPDSHLVRLYQGAEAVVVPSLREGFGLPAIEAVACGTPVVAAHGCPALDWLGEAAVRFNPEDAGELQRALETVLADATERERLRRGARVHRGAFDWSRSARQALAVFAEAAARHAR